MPILNRLPQTFGPYVIDAITQVAVTTQTNCRRVDVYENGQAGTADYLVRSPTNASPQITKPAGQKWSITCEGTYYPSGTVIAYIISSTGSMNFVQEEYP